MKLFKTQNFLLKFSSFNFSQYHSILGIRGDASKEQIKGAYYNLCKIHHPDHNSGKNTQKYIEIQKAYYELINNSYVITHFPSLSVNDILDKLDVNPIHTSHEEEERHHPVTTCDRVYFNNNLQGLTRNDLLVVKKKLNKMKKREITKQKMQNNVPSDQQTTRFTSTLELRKDKIVERHTDSDVGVVHTDILKEIHMDRIYFSSIKIASLASISSFTFLMIPFEFSIPLNLYITYLAFKK
jgi:hypothetical protein